MAFLITKQGLQSLALHLCSADKRNRPKTPTSFASASCIAIRIALPARAEPRLMTYSPP